MSAYGSMSSSTLKMLLEATLKDFLAATLAKDDDKIKSTTEVITEVELAIANKTAAQPSSSKEVDKSLDRDIRDRVARISEFGPASDVSMFIREARVVFNALVKGQDARVEKEFCRKLKMRLCDVYLEQLDRQSPTMEHFDTFVEYMDANHMSKKSAYQYMQSISELERRPDENIKDFALKVEAQVDRVATIVQAKFDKAKDAEFKVKAEPGGTVPAKMTAKDVFTMLAGSVVLAEVKRETSTYNAIINDLDTCWSGREIALKALAVSDRISRAPDTVETITIAHAKSTNEKPICWNFRDDKPCVKKPCPFVHDYNSRAEQRKSESGSRPTNGGGRRNTYGNNYRGNRGKPKANVVKVAEPAQMYAPDSNAATVNMATIEFDQLTHFPPRPLA